MVVTLRPRTSIIPVAPVVYNKQNGNDSSSKSAGKCPAVVRQAKIESIGESVTSEKDNFCNPS